MSFHDLQSSKICHQEVDTHRATISAAFQVPVEALLAVTLILTSVPGPVTVPSQKDRVVPDCQASGQDCGFCEKVEKAAG